MNFRPIGKTRLPPWPLIGWDIFNFSSETAEQNSTKLNRKQDLNVLYQVCVFHADRKNKMAALASDWLRHYRLLFWNRWTEFNKTWQDARSQRPLPSLCFSGRSVNKNVDLGRFLKKVAHCTQVHDMWPFGPLVLRKRCGRFCVQTYAWVRPCMPLGVNFDARTDIPARLYWIFFQNVCFKIIDMQITKVLRVWCIYDNHFKRISFILIVVFALCHTAALLSSSFSMFFTFLTFEIWEIWNFHVIIRNIATKLVVNRCKYKYLIAFWLQL